MKSSRVGLGCVVALALVPACGSDENVCDQLSMATPTVQIGTGATTFEPLADGGTLVINEGPQGGFHVFGSILAENFDPGVASDDPADERNPRAVFTLTLDDGSEIAAKDRVAALDGNALESTRVGETVFLSTSFDDTLTMEGRSATFRLALTDTCGGSAEAQADVGLTLLLLDQ